jgi:hypothetical protein
MRSASWKVFLLACLLSVGCCCATPAPYYGCPCPSVYAPGPFASAPYCPNCNPGFYGAAPATVPIVFNPNTPSPYLPIASVQAPNNQRPTTGANQMPTPGTGNNAPAAPSPLNSAQSNGSTYGVDPGNPCGSCGPVPASSPGRGRYQIRGDGKSVAALDDFTGRVYVWQSEQKDWTLLPQIPFRP